MDPDHALIRYGRGDQAFAISSQVFEPDEHGRSYRFRPSTRSVWLRQITIRGGPFMMFQVLDTPAAPGGRRPGRGDRRRGLDPEHQFLGTARGRTRFRGRMCGGSCSATRSCRRCSTETPTRRRFNSSTTSRDAWKLSVSILNTGHIGYSPEQYYYSLLEYGERFRPHFVVVSVCPNDFGDGSGGDARRGRLDERGRILAGKDPALVPGALRALPDRPGSGVRTGRVASPGGVLSRPDQRNAYIFTMPCIVFLSTSLSTRTCG